MSKSNKPEKLISAKKLPSLLKKKYTEKNFEKKILKKIYIEEDKNYLKSLFVENGKTKKDVQLYAIPQEKEFSKTEITRLKSLAKEIKKQKGRVKLVPLFAVLIFIAIIVVFTLFFKNKIIKTVIINAVQNSTETRCDIEYLNLSIFDATFNLRGFAVADKKDPMKNTVSVDTVNIDFNMLELLKKKFIANDICVTGFELNSDRKYTGELSSAELKKIHTKKEKKAEKERIKAEKKRLKKSQPKKESALAKQIKANAGKAADNVKDSVSEIFAPYNPETMFSNMFNSLKTPPLADIVKTDVEKYTAKYQTFPAELETDVNTAKGIVDSIQSINIEELKKDPLKIKDTIELLTKSYNEVVTLTEKTQKKINDIQKDVDAVSKLSKAIQDGITSDTEYVKKEVSKLTSIKLDDGMKFVSGSFSTILYNLLGNYYPYYEKGTELLETIKNNKKEKTPKKKTTVSKRSPGRNIYYTVDPNPTLWIKNLEGSGGTISFKVTDITNDMDKTADTTKAIVAFSAAGITHNADLIFDARKTSDAPLVYADYTCSNVPFSYSAEKLGNVPGIPGIDSSKGKIGLKFNIFDEENFDIDGNVDLAELKLSAQSFSPEFVSVIYNNVLEGINKMTASVQVANTSEKGFNLNFNSDIDKVFLASLEKEISEELNKLKKQVEEELVKKINEYTNGALGEIQNFTDLKNQIYEYKNQIDNFSGEVQKKLSDAEGLLKNTVDEAEKALKKAADDAKKQAEEEAKKMLEEAEKKAKEELQKKQDEAKAEAEKALKEAEEKAKKKAAEEAKKALKMLF